MRQSRKSTRSAAGDYRYGQHIKRNDNWDMRKRFHSPLHSFILISHWLSIYMKMIFHHNSNSVGLGPITDVVSIVMWIIQFPCLIHFSSLSRFFSCFSSFLSWYSCNERHNPFEYIETYTDEKVAQIHLWSNRCCDLLKNMKWSWLISQMSRIDNWLCLWPVVIPVNIAIHLGNYAESFRNASTA